MDPVLQLTGIYAGIIIAVVTLLCSVYAWDSNRRQQDMQRQFREAREDTQRQFQEARKDMQRQFQEARADMQRQFQEARADTQRQFQEARADRQLLREDMQQQFQQVREENRREHLEILRVIAQHLHIEDGRVVAPVGDANPTGTPAPADN